MLSFFCVYVHKWQSQRSSINPLQSIRASSPGGDTPRLQYTSPLLLFPHLPPLSNPNPFSFGSSHFSAQHCDTHWSRDFHPEHHLSLPSTCRLLFYQNEGGKEEVGRVVKRKAEGEGEADMSVMIKNMKRCTVTQKKRNCDLRLHLHFTL